MYICEDIPFDTDSGLSRLVIMQVDSFYVKGVEKWRWHFRLKGEVQKLCDTLIPTTFRPLSKTWHWLKACGVELDSGEVIKDIDHLNSLVADVEVQAYVELVQKGSSLFRRIDRLYHKDFELHEEEAK